MPYFLVTHTSLVEADDEATAATKVYDEICDRENLTFTVTADEHVTTKITIATRAITRPATPLHPALPSGSNGTLSTSEALKSDAPVVDPAQSASGLFWFSRLSKRVLARFKRE
jgi:hypothetical protein